LQDEVDRDQLLLSLADDFKRYYFERWREELAMQRGSPSMSLQQTLIAGKVNDTNSQLAAIATQLDENTSTMRQLYECVDRLIDHCSNLEQRVSRIEGLLLDDGAL
jgi:hypothetical protein